ncbi:hypothetical protein [Kosakonia phage Kc304]|uniref:Uncharacterized protein n=2 Tax=Winklervirus chi14 TaxID=2560752 RepID=A0A1Z1LYD9_9CAUD|nr:hypothetical protein FDI23_gp129 [Serratia phage CHI14]ARW57552.1 hypothetical protein [Serratia phage CHI14]ARW57827.1 hypothetical protein [Serratia phage CBH8]QYN80575.1 hypothetical protein [Kosakonia phage Kc304]
MIKTIYRGYKKSSYNEEGWIFLLIGVIAASSAILGFGTYFTLFFFSPIYGGALMFLAISAAITSPVFIISRWLMFVSQYQRGTFDKEPVKEKVISKKDEALDFIRGIRS